MYKTGVADGRSNNYKDVYDLLDKLCQLHFRSIQKKRDVLQSVTQYISNCPTALSSTLPYDDATLMANISQQLNTSTNLGCATSPKSKTSSFHGMHEKLKTSQLNSHNRNALLTFLYYMANPKYGYSQSSRHLPASSISPVRNTHDARAMRSQYFFNTTMSSEGAGASGSTRYGAPTPLLPTHSYDISDKFAGLRKAARTKSCGRTVSSNNETTSASSNGQTLRSSETLRHQHEVLTNMHDDIVQNIIYAFTGIEGRYLKKDVITQKFKLDTKVKTLNVVQAGMLLRLSEMGYYHNLLQSYADGKSGLCALGLMGQGLVSELRKELTKYYGMVAMLQEQFNKQRNTGNSVNPSAPGAANPNRLTLLKIGVWFVEPLQRLQWLAKIADACQAKKGGALASTIHRFLCNGNPMVKNLARELLLAVCAPLYQMLTRWLLEGELCDPHAEFFIECMGEARPDRIWHEKYRVRVGMLPDFISTDLANKILVTGKSINFLCEICEDKQPVKGRDELRQCIEDHAEHIFSHVADTKLHSTIDTIYLNTSKRVLDIVMGPHKLLEHLQAMRRYLLLGQGDFIGILMENLKHELDKPAKELYSYDLSSIMDAAIRSTNIQYDDPEILNHLDVRLMTPCDGDIGWDILSLQYTLNGPLATIFDPSMGIYQTLFKPLWRMKHMEFVLSSKIWIDQMCNKKLLRSMSAELNKVLYRLHLCTAEMIHFIHQMQYYILFEVIECSWVELQERVQQAKALDDIVNAHDDYLNAIKCGAFLDPNSKELGRNLEAVYDGVIHLEVWQEKFFDCCIKELSARNHYNAEILRSEDTGEFGVTTAKQEERAHEIVIFEQMINSYEKALEHIASNYEKAVRLFLLTLNSNNDHSLQLFGIRLDFNEYYKKRDQRLGVPLTFEHMRLSNVFFSSITNKSMQGSHRYSSSAVN